MRHEIKELDSSYEEQYVNDATCKDLSLYVSIRYRGKNSKKSDDRLLAGLEKMEAMISEIRHRIESK
jgi:hypothetical protein